ncbi:ras GTPase-activating [Labeo rohita]|uniref:Ras GTPase-activating n=1 Tax=Labeo rohita TaxID=84645 RepID=A0A498LAC2_LABRO|nr:ras GTPase-activating [Labeo rohita]
MRKNRDQRNTNNKMSRNVEVIINNAAQNDQTDAPVHITESKPGEHPGVKGFLMICPAVLGVITSQVLNLLNICNVVAAIILFFVTVFIEILKDALFEAVLRAHLLTSRSVSSNSQTANIIFIACNVLALILSLLIIGTSCCWCRSRKRLVVIHMSSASAAEGGDEVDYPCLEPSPPAYSPVPSSDPPAYEEERRSTLSGVSSQRWAMRKWKEELQRSRKPIQV